MNEYVIYNDTESIAHKYQCEFTDLSFVLEALSC